MLRLFSYDNVVKTVVTCLTILLLSSIGLESRAAYKPPISEYGFPSKGAIEHCRGVLDKYSSFGMDLRRFLLKCHRAYDQFLSEMKFRGIVDQQKELARLESKEPDEVRRYLETQYPGLSSATLDDLEVILSHHNTTKNVAVPAQYVEVKAAGAER
ncbi:MAG: hypothetical protein AB7G93_22065 [Bdellovibrionales bacterium]